MKEKSHVIGDALEHSNQRITHIDKRIEKSEYDMQKNSNECAKLLR